MITFEALRIAIRGSKTDRERAIRQLTSDKELQQKVKAMVHAKGGNTEDATMVYSDTIVAFLKVAFAKRDFSLNTSMESYIVGIGRHKWYDILKKRNTYIDTTDLEDIDPPKQEADQYLLLRKTEKWAILEKVLSAIANRCKEVIMYWASGFKMAEIAEKINYKSEGMARKKKSECMKELLAYLHDHPHIKEQLK